MKRILVVDDSLLILEAVRDALEPDGIEVEGFHSLRELERAGALGDFDLILLDAQIPGTRVQDLVEVTRRSRPTGPVVLLSSLSEEELTVRARELGLDGYIVKDRGVARFIDEIHAWLDGERPRRSERA
jgi:DNA-binding response OmpR family regulator